MAYPKALQAMSDLREWLQGVAGWGGVGWGGRGGDEHDRRQGGHASFCLEMDMLPNRMATRCSGMG